MKIKSFFIVIAVIVILAGVYAKSVIKQNENLTGYDFGTQEQYLCSQEKTFRVAFSERRAEVTFPDSTVYNFDKISEDDSGIKYSFDGDQKMNLWIKDLSAFIERDGVTIYKGCRLNGALINYPEETWGQTEPYQADITGDYVACLPYVHEPTTKRECVAGLRSDIGTYYRLDFNKMKEPVPKFKDGDRISGSGMVTPVETLNSDDWKLYEIKGIFTITDSLRILNDAQDRSDALTNFESGCGSARGNFDAKYSECNNVSAQQCSAIGGNFNECASACRHDPSAQVCTMQCVQVCEFPKK